ncbi:hypothetical protein [Mesorhizobium sp. 113-1-2]|uniref:hypothetical protein n=1 Tax=Mesorhizobium sp. 113-1-2 TaxID=2744515 RepID=UPI0019251B85|nr:hypothetical protein [Mesorhizobium sp. 113-1-2]
MALQVIRFSLPQSVQFLAVVDCSGIRIPNKFCNGSLQTRAATCTVFGDRCFSIADFSADLGDAGVQGH